MPALPTDTAPLIAEEFAANETGVLTPASFLNVVPEDVASNIFEPATVLLPNATEPPTVALDAAPKAIELPPFAADSAPNETDSYCDVLFVPIAIAKSPFVVALSPIATPCLNVALALLPIAMVLQAFVPVVALGPIATA